MLRLNLEFGVTVESGLPIRCRAQIPKWGLGGLGSGEVEKGLLDIYKEVIFLNEKKISSFVNYFQNI